MKKNEITEVQNSVMEDLTQTVVTDETLKEEEVKEVNESKPTMDFSAVLEDVAKTVAEEEQPHEEEMEKAEKLLDEAIEKGKSLGERMAEVINKFPNKVKELQSIPREEQFEYARAFIDALYLRGKEFRLTCPLGIELMEMDQAEEQAKEEGDEKQLSLLNVVKNVALKVINTTLNFVTETIFFSLDVLFETTACLARLGGHLVVELAYTGGEITKSFKRHYLEK